MSEKKITFLVSDIPGWTVGTKQGNSAFLNVGDKIEASEVVDSIITSLEEGRPAYRELGHLEQINLADMEAAEAEKYAQLARVQGSEVVDVSDDDDDPENAGGGESEADLENKREGLGGPLYDPSEHKVDEVLAYLETKKDDAGEIERIKGLEAASSRASTQVAAFAPAES